MKINFKTLALVGVSILALTSCGLGSEITEDEFKTKAQALPSKSEAGYATATLKGSYDSDTSGTIAGVNFSSSVHASLNITYDVSSLGVLTLKVDNSKYEGDTAQAVVQASLAAEVILSPSSVVGVSGAKYYDGGNNKLAVKVEQTGDGISSTVEYQFNEYGFLYSTSQSAKTTSDGLTVDANVSFSISFSK